MKNNLFMHVLGDQNEPMTWPVPPIFGQKVFTPFGFHTFFLVEFPNKSKFARYKLPKINFPLHEHVEQVFAILTVCRD